MNWAGMLSPRKKRSRHINAALVREVAVENGVEALSG
jgi:hypothetical protein